MANQNPTTRVRHLTEPSTNAAFEDLRRQVDSIREDRALNARVLERVDPNDRNTRHISIPTNGNIIKIPHGMGRPFSQWERVDLIVDGATGGGSIVRVTTDGTNVCDESKEIWLKALDYPDATSIKVRLRLS